ncbi:MAG: hypothetical protein FWE06_04525 [Oscillospiraceae bacterium]|nr:hypothetical protein [Oscillospiraceae bacterium]
MVNIVQNAELIMQHSGAVAAAAIPIAMLNLSAETQQQLNTKLTNAKTAFIAAFPYYRDIGHAHIARYAWGQDYIPALRFRMSAAREALASTYENYNFTVLANGYPLPIVKAARLSGLCLTGRNGLAILPSYGSYIFLSAIVTNMPLNIQPRSAGFCHDCDIESCGCPTGALQFDPVKGTKLDHEKCLSFISQSRHSTQEQLQLLELSSSLYGCDLCQINCPYNTNPKESPYPEFQPMKMPNVRRPELLERNAKYAKGETP